MALGSTKPYYEWVEREEPSLRAQRVARRFIAEIGDQPWLAPSVPINELSVQPQYEVRSALLPVPREAAAIQVWYRHDYATGDVDLIGISGTGGPGGTGSGA